MKWKKYEKQLDYSYALGQFATYELINNERAKLLAVIIHEKLKKDNATNILLKKAKSLGAEICENSALLEKISGKENCFIAGVFEKYNSKILQGNHVVLVKPSDMGNLGTIIRTMLGFNYTNLAVINENDGAVDIFNPKVIRSSMGAFFSVNIELFNDFNEYSKKFANKKYAFCLSGEQELQNLPIKKENHSLVFGNEATGLSEVICNQCNKIKIRQADKIDSFNLAMSVGIALYEFSK